MKDIKNLLEEKLPNIPKLKNNPDWIMAYPDFCDKMEEIWDDDRKLFATIMYFITKDEKMNENGWSSMKLELKNLYNS